MRSPPTAYLWSFCLAFGQARQVMGTAASLHASQWAPGRSSHNLWLPVCAKVCTEEWLPDEGSPRLLLCREAGGGCGVSYTHLYTCFGALLKKGNLKVNSPRISFKLILLPYLYYSISISKTNETIRKSYSQCKCEFGNVLIWASRNAWTVLLWEQSDLRKEMDLSFCFVK